MINATNMGLGRTSSSLVLLLRYIRAHNERLFSVINRFCEAIFKDMPALLFNTFCTPDMLSGALDICRPNMANILRYICA